MTKYTFCPDVNQNILIITKIITVQKTLFNKISSVTTNYINFLTPIPI